MMIPSPASAALRMIKRYAPSAASTLHLVVRLQPLQDNAGRCNEAATLTCKSLLQAELDATLIVCMQFKSDI